MKTDKVRWAAAAMLDGFELIYDGDATAIYVLAGDNKGEWRVDNHGANGSLDPYPTFDLAAARAVWLLMRRYQKKADEISRYESSFFEHYPEIMWGVNGQEVLDADLDDCIERYLDSDDEDFEAPETITVEAYERMKLSRERVESHLSDMVESIDDDYGDPDGTSDPAPQIMEAWQSFCKIFVDTYEVWRCDRTPGLDRTINLAEWREKRRTFDYLVSFETDKNTEWVKASGTHMDTAVSEAITDSKTVAYYADCVVEKIHTINVCAYLLEQPDDHIVSLRYSDQLCSSTKKHYRLHISEQMEDVVARPVAENEAA